KGTKMTRSGEKNYWLSPKCAEAFWDQRLALPYQELLQTTVSRVQVRAGERWLDLGCGSGALTAALWRRGGGQLGEVIALDCNPINGRALDKLQHRLPGALARIRFVTGNFSDGLPQFPDAAFDGIVSGLAISYAEARDPKTGQYTDA